MENDKILKFLNSNFKNPRNLQSYIYFNKITTLPTYWDFQHHYDYYTTDYDNIYI